MLKRHIVINCTSDTVLRFLPPLHSGARPCGHSDRGPRRNLHRTCSTHHRQLRRRTTPWLAEQPSNGREADSRAERPGHPCALLRGSPAKTSAPSLTSPAPRCAPSSSSATPSSAIRARFATRSTPSRWCHVLRRPACAPASPLRPPSTPWAATPSSSTRPVLRSASAKSLADMARNVERWVDVIVLRTYAHDTITEMAANSRVPVINALSDFEHPCQASPTS